MGSLIRLIVGVPGAVVVTVGLFLLMGALIKGPTRLEDEKQAINIDVTAQMDDTDLNSANKEFKRPTLDAPPPPQDFGGNIAGVNPVRRTCRRGTQDRPYGSRTAPGARPRL